MGKADGTGGGSGTLRASSLLLSLQMLDTSPENLLRGVLGYPNRKTIQQRKRQESGGSSQEAAEPAHYFGRRE